MWHAGAKPEKNARKAEAQCVDNDKRRTTIRRKRTQPFTLALIYVSYIHSGEGGRGERVTRAYTVEVQTASVFYAQSLILLLFEP